MSTSLTRETPARGKRGPRGVLAARQGVGPLLQRDYWAVISNCRARPREIMDSVCHQFPEFAPPDRAVFKRLGYAKRALAVGDEMEVTIPGVGQVHVRVAHRDRQTITLITLEGHPEAGRITFGAYRNEEGDVIFHIRSRARSSTRSRYLGFLLVGNPMQTTTWTDFVSAVASTFGDGVIGYVHAETKPIGDEPRHHENKPTFLATGDS